MEIEVHNINGEKTGRSVTLSDEVFGIHPNDHVIWLDVKRYRNAQRQGTHKTRERSEMSGSTKKLHKQKGTGGSRKGDINNPLFRGGARIFGPRVRDYDIKVNKKETLLARCSALSYKAKDNALMVLENIVIEHPKTKDFIAILKALGIEKGKKILIVTGSKNDHLLRASGNVRNAEIALAPHINTYNIMDAHILALTEDAVQFINQKFNSQS